MGNSTVVRPQAGPQELFLSTPADVAFYGGAAGGGKSYGLLLDPLRFITRVAGFGAVIFRRTSVQVRNEGGLWDSSEGLYQTVGATARQNVLEWSFPPYGNKVKFAHMQYEDNRFDWQGAQIAFIGFDELTHFTRKQFLYMLSRNRSTCGVMPYVRGTYNPVPPDEEPGGWIHEFVGWYLDADGYPVPERSGALRWFINLSSELHWFDDKAAAVAFAQERGIPDHDCVPKSFTFIHSTVYDNKILLEKDPGYVANLLAQDFIDQERLLRGNHFIKPTAGLVFNRDWFEIVYAKDVPQDQMRRVRFWDLAATERKLSGKGDPDYTAGVLMGMVDNRFYILDAIAEQLGPAQIDDLIMATAREDGIGVPIRWEEEGGASGKRDSYHIASKLIGWDAMGVRPQGDKVTRSKALAAQAYAGNVKMLDAPWNKRLLNNLHGFPELTHDDLVDGCSGAFNELAAGTVGIVDNPFYG
jgi:predicted phage terminase large subunit-like protein